MELKILSRENKEVGTQRLPPQFREEFRPDIIRRAVEVIQSNLRQAYGADPRAGKKTSAKLVRRRRKFKGAYGKGLSRVPRKTMVRRGMQMIWVGAFAPGTVGGRRAHPPVVRDWSQKMNVKEKRKAIRSALTATVNKQVVAARGHKTPSGYPFALANEFEQVKKTKDLEALLDKIGLSEELARSSQTRIRAGRGKSRGRKYKQTVGPLLVVGNECPVMKAARNIPGVDAVIVDRVNAHILAPGGHPGRLTLFTQAALQRLEKERLFE